VCQFCNGDKPEVLEYSCGWCGETHHYLLTQTEREAEVLCLWRDLPADRKSQMLLILRYCIEHDEEMRESQAATVHPDKGAVGWQGSHQDCTTSP
jgi:hypothetical protein